MILEKQFASLKSSVGIMKNFRIRLQLEGGQWTYWLNKDQLERYREDQIKAVVIEETMSYQQYLKYMESKNA